MNTSASVSFFKDSVSPFRDFPLERLQPLVEDSRMASFPSKPHSPWPDPLQTVATYVPFSPHGRELGPNAKRFYEKRYDP